MFENLILIGIGLVGIVTISTITIFTIKTMIRTSGLNKNTLKKHR